MGNDVLVFAENRDGAFKKGALEAVNEGARLAEKLGGACIALAAGAGIRAAAPTLGQYGASRVLVADAPILQTYIGEAMLGVLAIAVEQVAPAAILMTASTNGKDLGPRLAARLGAGLAVDCTALALDGDTMQATRPIYAGKANETVRFTGRPWIISLRPNVFSLDPPRNGNTAATEEIAVATSEADLKARVKEIVAAKQGKVDLTEADTIVAGGRGLKTPEQFQMIDRLAEVLDATVGASRAVVDAGWRPHAEQVGQTGKTVSPNLYFAIGISGAIQHLAGMSSSKIIVAINKDPEAPIFKVADYGIVGDAIEILPVLTEAVTQAKQG